MSATDSIVCDASSRRLLCLGFAFLSTPLRDAVDAFCVAATSDFQVMPARLPSLQGGVATLSGGLYRRVRFAQSAQRLTVCVAATIDYAVRQLRLHSSVCTYAEPHW